MTESSLPKLKPFPNESEALANERRDSRLTRPGMQIFTERQDIENDETKTTETIVLITFATENQKPRGVTLSPRESIDLERQLRRINHDLQHDGRLLSSNQVSVPTVLDANFARDLIELGSMMLADQVQHDVGELQMTTSAGYMTVKGEVGMMITKHKREHVKAVQDAVMQAVPEFNLLLEELFIAKTFGVSLPPAVLAALSAFDFDVKTDEA